MADGEQSFSGQLREHRLAVSLTQAALAERAGISTRSIQALERGLTRPHRDTLVRLAGALGLSPDEQAVFGGAATPSPRRRVPAVLEASSTPVAVGSAKRNTLPLQLSSFIGRDRELTEVRRLLKDARLVTLTGAGGVGKTRLALQVGDQLTDAYADGVWLVELAPVADPALVPQTVASALGVQEQPRRALTETLADWLEPRELVLLLDNCEHLVAACAGLVDALLAACPSLRILATSREPLHLAGEFAWRVPSLSLPDPKRLPPIERLTRYDAIRLFVERAASIRSGFALTDRNAAALAQVCHQLDGIPLALELAAARVEVLTVEQLAARLDQRLSLLTGGARTALPRQQTLRATVDWSYQLLTEPERTLLRRLAVFASGWTLEAAEAICSGDGIDERVLLDLLAALVGKSLVQMEEKDGEARYRLLETVREYAWEKLRESEDESVVRRRHLEWFLSLAQRAAREEGGPDMRAWADRVATEHDNIRTSLEWSAAAGGDVEAGLRLVAAMRWLWAHRGYHREGRAWYSAFLARTQGRTAPRAWALNGAGYLALRQGDYSAAMPLLEESRSICRELGDKTGVTAALVALGEVLYAQSNFRRGKLLLEEAVALAREIGDWHWLHDALSRLGDITYHIGEYPQALVCYQETLAVSQQHGFPHGIGSGLRGLGQLATVQGDYLRARALLEESLGQFIELKDKRCTPRCLQALAWVASGLGQAERVARLLGAAEALRKAVGLEELPAVQADHEAAAAARAALGETTFVARWAEGQSMTLAEAVDYALSAEVATATMAPETGALEGPASLLTLRERQVAVLIAHGFTNRQIASELIVAESTAERHVANIMNKLGVNARSQVAAWAAEHKLSGARSTS